MERHASALKAARQAVKRNERNRAARANVRTVIKKFRDEAANKSATKQTLAPLLNQAQKVLMKAASKNLIKKKTASRYVSRLSALVKN